MLDNISILDSTPHNTGILNNISDSTLHNTPHSTNILDNNILDITRQMFIEIREIKIVINSRIDIAS